MNKYVDNSSHICQTDQLHSCNLLANSNNINDNDNNNNNNNFKKSN